MAFSFGGFTITFGENGFSVDRDDDAPDLLAVDDRFVLREDRSVTIRKKTLLRNDSTSEDGDFSFYEFTQPENGVIEDLGNRLRYTPDEDFFGDDEFTYTIQSADGELATASVDLVVLGRNDRPEGNDVQLETGVDTPLRLSVEQLLADSNAVDVDGDELSISLRNATKGTVKFDPDDSNFIIFTPKAGYEGDKAGFNFFVEDGNGGRVRLTANIDLGTPGNSAPTAADDAYNVDEGGEVTGNLISDKNEADLADSDPEGAALFVTQVNGQDLSFAVDTDEALIAIAEGDLFVKSDGSFRYVHAGDEPLGDSPQFEYTLSDGDLTDTGLVTIAVTNVNDLPTGTVTISGTATEGSELTADNDLADADGLGAINYQWQRGGVNIDGATGARYTLTQADVDATITVIASYTDGTGTAESVASAATAAVTAMDAPFADEDEIVPTEEDTQLTGNVLDNAPASTADGDVLVTGFEFGGASYDVGDTAAIDGVGSLTIAADGTYTFEPAVNYNGDVPEATYTMSDDGGATDGDTSTLAISILPVNDAPESEADTATTEALASVVIHVLGNDSDLESSLDPSSVEIVTNGAKGSAVANPDGTISYTADNFARVDDTFTYRVADTDGAFSEPVTVTVALTGNEADGNGQDGYISGGFVWADRVVDGVFNPGQEAFGTTNNQGEFTLLGNTEGTLYLTGGVDVATLLPFDGVLKAPEGSTVITPLTTLVVAVLEDDSSLTIEEAEGRVKAALSLPDVNLSAYDPIAVLSDPNAEETAKEAAADIFSTASQVLNTATIVGSAVAGAAEEAVSTTAAEDAAFASLAELVNNTDTTVDLQSSAVVASIVQETATQAAVESGNDTIVVQIAEVAELATASNTAVETSVTEAASSDDFGGAVLSGVSQVSQVAQGETAEAVGDGDVSAEDTTQFVDNLDDQVDEAVVGDADGETENADDDLLIGTAADDVLDGGVGNDTIVGNAGDDTLTGGEGDDIVTGGTGDDTLIAGAGNDVYQGSASSFDIIDYSSSLSGINVNLETGVVSDDGLGGTDSLENIDRVVGSAFNDTIVGRLDAPGVFDRFRPGDGVDFIDGQGGNDAVDYRDAVNGTNGVTIDLGADGDARGTAIDPWDNTDTLVNINRAFGSDQDDTITGDGQDNVLFGEAGNDQIFGGAGRDLIFGGDGDDTLANGTGEGNYLEGNAGNDTFLLTAGTAYLGDFNPQEDRIDLRQVPSPVTDFSQIQAALNEYQVTEDDGNGGAVDVVHTDIALPGLLITLRGVAQAEIETAGAALFDFGEPVSPDDQIGDEFDNTLEGGAGDTNFEGGAGSDTIIAGPGNDSIDGGEGFDFADYSGAGLGIQVDLGAQTVTGGFGGTDSIVNIEKVIATNFDDSLVGADTDAPQSFEGRGGDDYIDGGAGVNDRVDHRFSDTGSGISADLSTGIVLDEFGGTDTVLNIERVYGTIYDDVIVGDDNDNQFIGERGADDIDGGAGFDSLFNNGDEDQALNINLATGQVSNDGFGFTGSVAGIEQVFGTQQDDTIVGDANRNELFGQDGNDILNHGSGDGNYLEGGAGNDTFALNSGSVYIGDFNPLEDRIDLRQVPSPVTDFSQIQAALNEYQVTEDDGNGGAVDVVHTDIALPGLLITLRGVAQAEIETAGAALFDFGEPVSPDDQIGDEFDNTLEGGAGDTTFNAGAGNDTIIAGPGSDTIDGGADFDLVDYSAAGLAINADFSTGVVTGGFGGTDTLISVEKIVATDFADSLIGANTDDVQRFDGRGGDDYIDGGTGINDGIDHRFSDTGSGINADLSTGVVQDEFGGTDTVVNIERVYGTIYDDVITGDDNDNQFIGDRGYDVINGGGGVDNLFANLTEDQSLIIDLSSGVVTNDGYGFGGEVSNIENVFGTPNDDIIIGDSRDNLLVGDAGSDVLDGGAGNDVVVAGFNDDAADTLIDGAGSDYLEGGPGADTFVIQGGGDDSIGQFELGVDKIDLTTLPFLVTEAEISSQLNDQSNTDSGTFFTFGTATLFVGGDSWNPDEEISLSDFILPSSTAGSIVDGTDGDDSLDGTDGDDTFNALGNTENGIDFIIGGAGNDTIDGGDGFDAVDYSAAPAGISADLESGAIADGFGGIDTVVNIERVIGSAFNDVIFGRTDNQNPVFDRYLPGDGADFIDGRGGNDVVDYREDDTGTGITLSFAFNGQGNGAAIDPYGNFDTILNVSGVFATEFDDRLFGGDEANRLIAFGGDDVVAGLGGDDVLVGGAGFDELRGGQGDDFFEGGTEGDNFVVSNGSAFIADFEVGVDTIDFRETQAPVPDVAALETALVEFTPDDPDAEDFGVVYSEFRLDSVTVTLSGVSNDQLRVNGDPNEALNPNLFIGFVTVDPDQTISGTEFDDNFGDNTQLDGGSGNDTIDGGIGGNDALRGFAGNDTLTGGDGDDYLEGGFGSDQLFGGDGDFDNLAGGPGDDLLDGGNGFSDNIDYSSSQFQTQRGAVINLSEATFIEDFDGNTLGARQARDPDGGLDTLIAIETVSGTDFGDTIIGNAGDNFLFGGAGDDYLNGAGGNDNYGPGSGSDTVDGDGDDGVDYFDYGRRDGFDPQFNSPNGIFVNLGEEGTNFNGFGPWLEPGQAQDPDGFIDQLNGINGVNGTAFTDIIVGGNRDDFFAGEDGNDFLIGGAGNDNLSGGAGDDELRAGDGVNDSLVGGAGNDNFVVGNGGVFIEDFELGVDTIDLRETGMPVPDFQTILDAATSYDQDESEAQDGSMMVIYTDIALGGLNITLRGIDRVNLLESDFVEYRGVDADNFGAASIDGTEFDDNFELVNPQLDGGSGNDTINGLAGNDALRGFFGNDVLNGDEGDDYLEGGFGNDQLFGGEGFDSLNGGGGNDLIDGGDGPFNPDEGFDEGYDEVLYDGGYAFNGDLYLNLSEIDPNDPGRVWDFGNNILLRSGQALDPDGGLDTLVGIEGVRSGDGNDQIVVGAEGVGNVYAGGGDDGIVVAGGWGANIQPGDGNNYVDGGNEWSNLDLNDGQFANPNGVGIYLGEFGTYDFDLRGEAFTPDGFVTEFYNINNANGGEFADGLFGNSSNNNLIGRGGDDIVVGNDGDDYLQGDGGIDELRGGEGNDHFVGGSEGDNFVVSNGAAFIEDFNIFEDSIDFRETAASVPNFSTVLNSAFERLENENGVDVVYTNIVLESVNITLRGVAKSDLSTIDFRGFAPRDPDLTVEGDGTDENFGTTGPLDGGSGNDIINGRGGFDDLRGFAGDDTLNGGTEDDYLEGGTGRDFLNGEEGDDNNFAGPGDDVINGGDGSDNVDYDSWQFQSQRGAVVNLTDFGGITDFDGNPVDPGTARDPDFWTDELISIENLTGSDYDDQFFGSEENNNLEGRAGNDALYGNGGDDFVSGSQGNDFINGGSGNDFLLGGQGLDTFEFGTNTGSDTIGDFNNAEDSILLIDGLTVASVTQEDTNSDGFDDATRVTFDNGEGDVLLSDILLTDQDLFG